KKSVLMLFVVALVVCLSTCVFVACNKNNGNDSDSYNPGDVVVSEKDVTWTVNPDGEIVLGEYEGKNIVVKYLLDNAAYLVIGGYEYDDMAITGYHGDVKSFSLKEIENRVNVGGNRISVTSIYPQTFYNCDTLESVDLSKSSKALSFEIGSNAFAYCKYLKDVTLPTNLYVSDNTIGERAFAYCEALTDVTIGEKFTNIGQYAFANCTALESITLPAGIKSIADYTFYNCEKLNTLSFTGEKSDIDVVIQPELALKKIGKYAFANTALVNGNFNKFENLRVIGANAFKNTAITAVTIPDSISVIESGAFYNCDELKTVDIPFLGTNLVSNAIWSFGSVYGYDKNEYDLDRGLSVRVRGTLHIPIASFATCSDIASVTISYFDEKNLPVRVYNADGVSFTDYTDLVADSEIPSRAFYGCSELTYLTLSKNPTVIGESAFELCESIRATQLPLSDELISIGARAFASCYSLTDITIPSVTTIGTAIFADCKSLESIEFEKFFREIYGETDEGSEVVIDIMHLPTLSYYFANTTELSEAEVYQATSAYSNVFVPYSLKNVKANYMYYVPSDMFRGFASLENIEIATIEISDYENSVLGSIGSYAFADCTNLSNLTINAAAIVPGGISASAFRNCENITALPLTLPLLNGIVEGCLSLREVTVQIPTSPSSWYLANLFAQYSVSSNELLNNEHNSLHSVTLVVEDGGYIPANLLNGASYITEIVFDADKVNAIGKDAFNGTGISTNGTDYVVIYDGWVIGLKSNSSFTVLPATITGIADNAISNNVEHIFFEGTSSQWSDVHRGNLFDGYIRNVYMYSETEPSGTGKYWHYEDETKQTLVVWGGDKFGVVNYEFNLGNGTVESLKIEASYAFEEDDLSDLLPYIEGKAFDGWYLDEDYNTPVTFPYKGENGYSLYAKWKDLTKYTLFISDEETFTVWADGALTENDLPIIECPSNMRIVWHPKNDESVIIELPYYGEYGYTLTVEFVEKGYEITSSDYSYGFIEDNGTYTSTNQTVDSSTAGMKIIAYKDLELTCDWSVSSESSYDKLTIKTINEYGSTVQTYVSEASGSRNGAITVNLSKGQILVITYTKDSSSSSGDDCATIENLVVNVYGD
ncbi:MAG: leucine-rich repeat domain-containing protein, partial [Clostridia bacterium]|nr:leucine-rich repeat domain-containing protein [Clostridia bacterium]